MRVTQDDGGKWRCDGKEFASEEAARLYAASRASPATTNAGGKFAGRPILEWRIAGFIFVAGMVSYFALPSCSGPPQPRTFSALDAQMDCEQRIKLMLKAPKTAEFASHRELKISGSGSGPYTVVGYVDAQNSFGAMLRSMYTCTLEYRDTKVHFTNAQIF